MVNENKLLFESWVSGQDLKRAVKHPVVEGMHYMNEMKISRIYRDSRLPAIGGGANEVMSDIIARMAGL